MTDVFTPAKRSEVMSRIRGRGNRETELALVKLLRQHRISGWRRHLRLRIGELRLVGKQGAPRKPRNTSRPKTQTISQLYVRPDFVFPRQRTVVFVDGCFWHGCPKHSKLPANNRAFWEKKLTANKMRDQLVNRHLRKTRWRVVRIWEHDLTKRSDVCIRRIQRALGHDIN